MAETTLRSRLAERPRLVGVLFAVTLLLAHAGSAAAVGVAVIHGP